MSSLRPRIQQDPSRFIKQSSLAQASSTEIQRLNAFYSAIGARLLNEQAPRQGLDKEVHDAIMAILFPDVLNNPISRKRNLEFIIFLLTEAIKEQVFLEFLFTQYQLKLIADALVAYEFDLGREAARHQHRYLELAGNPPKKLVLQRITTLAEMLRLQTSMYSLRLETKQIYAAMGAQFTQTFNAEAANLLHPDPRHTIAIAVPNGGKIEVEQHGLVFHIRDFVSNTITHLESPPADFAGTIRYGVDRGAMDYIVRERPAVQGHFNTVRDIPELTPLLDKINLILNQSYLLDDRIRNMYSRTIEINNIYREQEAQLQRLAGHPSLNLNDALVFCVDQARFRPDEELRSGILSGPGGRI